MIILHQNQYPSAFLKHILLDPVIHVTYRIKHVKHLFLKSLVLYQTNQESSLQALVSLEKSINRIKPHP